MKQVLCLRFSESVIECVSVSSLRLVFSFRDLFPEFNVLNRDYTCCRGASCVGLIHGFLVRDFRNRYMLHELMF